MNAIVDSFHQLRETSPRLRARDAARHLGITEAELVASGAIGAVYRLRPDFKGLLAALPTLGPVTVICRNEAAVHETKGPFTPPEFFPAGALTHGGPIDLRLFTGPWKFAFAQVEPEGRQSVQFFDRHGVAVMKVFRDAGSPPAPFDALIEQFAEKSVAPLEIAAPAEKAASNTAVDVALLRERWGALQDTHDFFGMLKELEVERTSAMRAVGEEFSKPLRLDVTEALLRKAAERALPIMVFAGNHGAINIFTGPVRKIVRLDKWLNVLDPGFNLHLDETLVVEAFRVRKPTVDGVVTSIELFDAAGEVVAMFFGVRKPGRPELQAWRDLVAELEVAHA